MYLPPSISEEEFLRATNKVVNILARSFIFGSFTLDDIKQQGREFAIKSMAKYDPTRPLDNFLYAHVKHRLINFRRDNFHRNDPPCFSCHSSIDGETAHANKSYCEAYKVWLGRNTRKHNVISPLDISTINDEYERNTRTESNVLENVANAELLDIIDRFLPIEHRQLYLQLRAGVSIPKAKREQLYNIIRDILSEHNHE